MIILGWTCIGLMTLVFIGSLMFFLSRGDSYSDDRVRYTFGETVLGIGILTILVLVFWGCLASFIFITAQPATHGALWLVPFAFVGALMFMAVLPILALVVFSIFVVGQWLAVCGELVFGPKREWLPQGSMT